MNQAPYDLVVLSGPGEPPTDDVLVVHPDISRENLEKKVSQSSKDSFRASWLRELAQMGWLSVFYVGPFVIFSFLAAILLPGLSILFRKLSRKWALFSLAGLCLGSVIALLLVISANTDKIRSIQEIQSNRVGDEKTAKNLEPFFSDPDPDIRFEAILRLYRHAMERKGGTAGIATSVIELLDDPDIRVRLWACGTLGKLGDPAAIPHLLRALEDPEVFVRYRAAEGLGDLRAVEAIEPLKKMTQEDWWYCGMYALQALRKIRPEKF